MAEPPAQPTSVTLDQIFGKGFRTTLLAWRETIHGYDSDLVVGLNLMGEAKTQEARDAFNNLRRKIWDLERQLSQVEEFVESVKEILEVRKAEAEYKTTIVNAWPADLVAERVSYLGTGILAAGGAAYALSGYPSVSYVLLPTLVLWGVGLGLLLFGISRLVKNQRARFAFFRRQFALEIEGRA